MKKILILTLVLLATVASPAMKSAGSFKVLSGRTFDAAVPKDFYLEGSAIPVEKRNARLVIAPSGKRALFALIDTSGYSSQVQKKYIGMMITEGPLRVCGHRVGVGSYGVGLDAPREPSRADGRLRLYDQGGSLILACLALRDGALHSPRPLQVIPEAHGKARLYLGRYWVELQ